jgi:hypothetical protein
VQLRDATAGEGWRTDPVPVHGTGHTAVLLTRGHRYEFRVAATDGSQDGAAGAPVAVQVR